MEKNPAHHKGLLHRAVSVFIFNDKNEWLLQKRSNLKYHSPGQWSNTCCTHPFIDESYNMAAQRRLKEEMGLEVDLIHKFRFIYKAELENNMIEHELDTIFFGYSNELPSINPDEVSDYKYQPVNEIIMDMERSPQLFTPWFKKLILKIISLENI